MSDEAARGDLPEIDFSTVALPDPATGRPGSPDLTLASQTIDTLALLERKTRGNLDDEEQKLLTSLLYELRMRFVEVGKSEGD